MPKDECGQTKTAYQPSEMFGGPDKNSNNNKFQWIFVSLSCFFASLFGTLFGISFNAVNFGKSEEISTYWRNL